MLRFRDQPNRFSLVVARAFSMHPRQNFTILSHDLILKCPSYPGFKSVALLSSELADQFPTPATGGRTDILTNEGLLYMLGCLELKKRPWALLYYYY